MILTDLHMHSTYSLDGNNTIAELREQAIQVGLTQIAVTDHVEWPPHKEHQRPDFDRDSARGAHVPGALRPAPVGAVERAGAR